MRSPILQKATVQHRAATQRFIPMPTNYNELANAQVRAAQAQGRMGLAIAGAGAEWADAAIEIDLNNQRADLLTKKSELESFVSGFYAEQTQRRDLNEMDAEGNYNYTKINEQLESELRAFEKQLDKKYGITDPKLKSAYAADRLGLIDGVRNKINTLAMESETERLRAQGVTAFAEVRREQDWEKWKEAYGPYFSPADMAKNELIARDIIVSDPIKGRIDENYDVFSLIGTDGRSDTMMAEVDALYASGQISEQRRNDLERDINNRVSFLKGYYGIQIENAGSIEEAEAWRDEAVLYGAQTDQDATNAYKKRASLLTTDSVMGTINNGDGTLTNDVGMLRAANDALNKANINGDINPRDYGEAKKKILKHIDSTYQITLASAYDNGDITKARDMVYALSDSDVDPTQYGFSGTDDPMWNDFKTKAQGHLADLERKDKENAVAYTKTKAVSDTAGAIVMSGGQTMVNGTSKTVMGPDGKEYSVSASDVKDKAWEMLTFSHPDHPVDETRLLNDYLAKHKFVPTGIATNLAADIQSGDPQRIAMALASAEAMFQSSGNRLTKDSFSNEKLFGAFQMARELNDRLTGINLSTETGRRAYENAMADFVNPQVVPEDQAKKSRTDFEEKKRFGDALDDYGGDSDIFEAFGDDAMGSSDLKAFIGATYQQAIEAGKPHDVAAKQAIEAATAVFEMEGGVIVRDRWESQSVYADSEFTDQSRTDFAAGVHLMTPEAIASGYTVETPYAPEDIRFQKINKNEWMMTDPDGRPIIHRLIDKNGAVVEGSGTILVVDANSLSPGAKAQADVQAAEQAAFGAERQVEMTQSQLEQESEAAMEAHRQKGATERQTSRGTRKVYKEEPLKVEPWHVEYEEGINARANDPTKPMEFEMAQMQKELLIIARTTGMPRETFEERMEEIRRVVTNKYETAAAIAPEPTPPSAEDNDVGGDIDGSGDWEVDLQGRKTKGQDVEENERVDASKKQIREMRRAAKSKWQQ